MDATNRRRGTIAGSRGAARALDALEHRFHETLEAEKLDSLKELAYGAGHEINNPLANISARAQTLLQLERDPERRRMLAAINSQAFRAHEMIADMMLFARPPQPKLERVDLTAAVDRRWPRNWPRGRPAADASGASNCRLSRWSIEADATQIAVAVRAVCINSLEALVTRRARGVGSGRVPAIIRRRAPFLPASRNRADFRVGQWPWNSAAGAAAHFRSVLFGPRSRPRAGIWAVEVLANRDPAWGANSRGKRRRRRSALIILLPSSQSR